MTNYYRLYGRPSCPFCEPYLQALKRVLPEVQYYLCRDFEEPVPRLVALTPEGKVIGTRVGVMTKPELEVFINNVESSPTDSSSGNG